MDFNKTTNNNYYFVLCRKQRKRSDGSKGSGDKTGKSGSNNLIDLLPPKSPRDRHSDQDSVTTVEPQSEPEDFDDQRSESIVSSVGAHESEENESDAKSVPTVEVTTPSETNGGTPNGTVTVYCK